MVQAPLLAGFARRCAQAGRVLLPSAFVVAIAACGARVDLSSVVIVIDGGAEGTPPGPDGDVPGPSDAGIDLPEASPLPPPPSTRYPADHAPFPIVSDHGGRVLEHVKIVTVTFDRDPNRGTVERFGDTITATPWWSTVTAGYCDHGKRCIGSAAPSEHVHLPLPPIAAFTDSSQGAASSLQAYMKAKLADHSLPAPTADTLFMFYLPSSLTVTLDGADSCSFFDGYHGSLELAASPNRDGGAGIASVAYAVSVDCGPGGPQPQGALTITAAHELLEAATDPDVNMNQTQTWETDEIPWAANFAPEVGDLCVDLTGRERVTAGGFAVQRIWSYAEAAKGADPCVPAVPSKNPYFNASIAVADQTLTLRKGESKTIEVDAWSAAPIADWRLDAVENDAFVSLGKPGTAAGYLTLRLDGNSANNGTKRHLTVTLAASTSSGYAPFLVTSSLGTDLHVWAGIVIEQ